MSVAKQLTKIDVETPKNGKLSNMDCDESDQLSNDAQNYPNVKRTRTSGGPQKISKFMLEVDKETSFRSFDDAMKRDTGYKPLAKSIKYKNKYGQKGNNMKIKDLIKQRTYSYAKKVKTSALLLWDGLIFFGFDDTKINRLKQLDGENKSQYKTGFTDKCTSPRWIIYNLVFWSTVLYFIVGEVEKFDTPKSRSIEINEVKEQIFDLSEHMQLVGTLIFQKSQLQQSDETYLCQNSEIMYLESSQIGNEYKINNFKFDCKMQERKDENFVYLNYYLGISGYNHTNFGFTEQETSDDNEDDSVQPLKNHLYQKIEKMASQSKNLQTLNNEIRFKESLDHNNYFVINFDESLNGLKTEFIMHQTSIGKNPEVYDSWKFKSAETWNEFQQNASKIFKSQKFVIGKQRIAQTSINANSIKTTHKNFLVKTKFLGLHLNSEDLIEYQIRFGKPQNIDHYGKVPVTALGDNISSNIIVPIMFNFDQTQYKIEYYGAKDVVATLGGINGFFRPFIDFFIPVMMLIFLWRVAAIVREHRKRDYADAVVKYMDNAIQSFEYAVREKIDEQIAEVSIADELQEILQIYDAFKKSDFIENSKVVQEFGDNGQFEQIDDLLERTDDVYQKLQASAKVLNDYTTNEENLIREGDYLKFIVNMNRSSQDIKYIQKLGEEQLMDAFDYINDMRKDVSFLGLTKLRQFARRNAHEIEVLKDHVVILQRKMLSQSNDLLKYKKEQKEKAALKSNQ